MTDGEPMSSDEARRRSWVRLRRAHADQQDKTEAQQDRAEAQEWKDIGVRNHFGPSFESAVRASMMRRGASRGMG